MITIIRGEPERAPNTRVTYGEFAVPMYLSVYVALRRPRAHSACAICLRSTSSLINDLARMLKYRVLDRDL